MDIHFIVAAVLNICIIYRFYNLRVFGLTRVTCEVNQCMRRSKTTIPYRWLSFFYLTKVAISMYLFHISIGTCYDNTNCLFITTVLVIDICHIFVVVLLTTGTWRRQNMWAFCRKWWNRNQSYQKEAVMLTNGHSLRLI